MEISTTETTEESRGNSQLKLKRGLVLEATKSSSVTLKELERSTAPTGEAFHTLDATQNLDGSMPCMKPFIESGQI